MHCELSNSFQQLRDAWALKAVITQDRIEAQMRIDMNANPHNDNYPNKRPRREPAVIVSDLSYEFADNVLGAQYPGLYPTWLRANGYKLVWGFNRKEY